MKNDKVIEALESLNVTLGAIKDVIVQAGSDKGIEDAFELCEKTLALFQTEMEGQSVAVRLARINRELSAQLEGITALVKEAQDTCDNVTEIVKVDKLD